MLHIAISGSYGGCNLGDEAILRCIIDGFREAGDFRFTVFTGDVRDTTTRHKVERAVRGSDLSNAELAVELEGVDLFVLGGGGILFDHWVKEHLRETMIAEDLGIPVVVYAVGVGPLRERRPQEAVRECIERAAAVTVRDMGAHRELERLGVQREMTVTADPALLLKPEPLPSHLLEREGLGGKRRLVGMSVREPGPAAPDISVDAYHALLANAADYMVDRFKADIVFVPMEPGREDTRHSHAVIGKMRRAQRATVLRGEYSAPQMLELVSHFAFAVGMRLHFLLFSALQRVPFVALPYAGKVRGFLEDLHLEDPPLEELTIGQLLAYIDASWDKQDSIRALIDRGLPALQERAGRSRDIALSVIETVPPKTPSQTG